MQHFLLCHEKKLQLFGFGGKREREWTLDAEIRYVKVTGGPSPEPLTLTPNPNPAVYPYPYP
jgi:intraflagellar transport protein 122